MEECASIVLLFEQCFAFSVLSIKALAKILMVSSTSKNPDVQIHTPSRHHTPDRLLPTGIILALPRRIPIHPIHHRPFHHPRGPPQTTHEMPVRVINRLHTLAFLSQIPAPDRLVVADAEEILAARVEDERADPVVVPNERFHERTPRVPDLDALVPGARGEVFARTARWWRFLESGERGQVRVGGGGSEDAAFDDVLVAEERGFGFAGAGVPESCGLVVAGGEQPSAVEAGRYVPDPVDVPAERFDAVACADVPYAERLVAGG